MLKALIDRDAKIPTVIIGLSYANIAELRKDNPIVFNLQELKLHDFWICLTYKHPDGMVGVPDQVSNCYTLAFDDEILDYFINSGKGLEMKRVDDIHFFVFARETEKDMEDMLRKSGCLGPHTNLTRSGQGPTDDMPPSAN